MTDLQPLSTTQAQGDGLVLAGLGNGIGEQENATRNRLAGRARQEVGCNECFRGGQQAILRAHFPPALGDHGFRRIARLDQPNHAQNFHLVAEVFSGIGVFQRHALLVNNLEACSGGSVGATDIHMVSDAHDELFSVDRSQQIRGFLEGLDVDRRGFGKEGGDALIGQGRNGFLQRLAPDFRRQAVDRQRGLDGLQHGLAVDHGHLEDIPWIDAVWIAHLGIGMPHLGPAPGIAQEAGRDIP